MIYEQNVVPSIWEDNTIITNTTSLHLVGTKHM